MPIGPMRDNVNTAGWIELTFRVYEEDGQYTGECVELGVASCGDTIDEAFRAICEAAELYINTLQDVGERGRVFAERGVVIHPGEPPDTDDEISVRARQHEYVSPARLRVLASV